MKLWEPPANLRVHCGDTVRFKSGECVEDNTRGQNVFAHAVKQHEMECRWEFCMLAGILRGRL